MNVDYRVELDQRHSCLGVAGFINFQHSIFETRASSHSVSEKTGQPNKQGIASGPIRSMACRDRKRQSISLIKSSVAFAFLR